MKKKKKLKNETAHYFKTAGDCSTRVIAAIETRYSAPGKGLPLTLLPPPTGGLRLGELTLIAGLPAQGKTAFLASAAVELAARKIGAAVFLPDSTILEFTQRMVVLKGGLNYSGINLGHFKRSDWPGVTRACSEISQAAFFFSGRKVMTAEDIEADTLKLAEAFKKEGRKLELVLVDSLNYLKPGAGDALLTLQGLARQLNLCVLASYGLHETGNIIAGECRLRDLRAAGLDEEHVDTVFSLRRPDCYERTGENPQRAWLRVIYSKVEALDSCQLLRWNSDSLSFTAQFPVPANKSMPLFPG